MTQLVAIADSADPSTWAVPTKTTIIVDCDVGSVIIETRRGSSDTAVKALSFSSNGAALELIGGRSILLDNPVIGREYRVRTCTPGVPATASIHE